MNVKQNLVSMVESVPIFSKVSTATVMGLDTLELSVRRKVITNLLPVPSLTNTLSMYS